MSLSRDLGRFSIKTGKAMDVLARTATLDLFTGVVKATPVDTGRARGAWTTSVGQPADSPERYDKIPVGQAGGAAFEEVFQNTPDGAGQVTYLSNTMPYIQQLEYGSSGQAKPGEMVRQNLARVQRMVDKAVKKLRV